LSGCGGLSGGKCEGRGRKRVTKREGARQTATATGREGPTKGQSQRRRKVQRVTESAKAKAKAKAKATEKGREGRQSPLIVHVLMIRAKFATACREFLDERLKTCRFFVPEDDGAASLREDEADVPFGKDYVAAVARRDEGG
jgi:hypothetical protein